MSSTDDASNDLVLLDALSDADADITTLELLSLFADDTDSACSTHDRIRSARNEKTATECKSADASQSTTAVDALVTELHAIATTATPLAHTAANVNSDTLSDMDTTFELIDLGLLDATGESDDTWTSAAPPLRSILQPKTTAAAASATWSTISTAPLPQATSALAHAPPVAIASKTTHQRTKAELQYLRLQVQELERQLETMRPSASESRRTSDRRDSTKTTTTAVIDKTATLSQQTLWERIAKRQLSAKHRAEVENQRLRDALESQLKIAQSLSKLLRKRPNLSWLEDAETETKRLRAEASSHNTSSVFERLAGRLDALVSRLDSVMQDAGVATACRTMQNGAVKCDGSGSVFLEVVDCHVVPFSVDATSGAMWSLFQSQSVAVANGVFHTIEVTDDVIRAQVAITLRLRRSEAHVTASLVGKRIVDAARVCFVWCSEGESEGSLLGANPMIIRESAWASIENCATGAPRDRTDSLTIVKSVVHMTPTIASTSAAEQSLRVGLFTDVVLSGFHENYTHMHRLIEDILMRRAQQA